MVEVDRKNLMDLSAAGTSLPDRTNQFFSLFLRIPSRFFLPPLAASRPRFCYFVVYCDGLLLKYVRKCLHGAPILVSWTFRVPTAISRLSFRVSFLRDFRVFHLTPAYTNKISCFCPLQIWPWLAWFWKSYAKLVWKDFLLVGNFFSF